MITTCKSFHFASQLYMLLYNVVILRQPINLVHLHAKLSIELSDQYVYDGQKHNDTFLLKDRR